MLKPSTALLGAGLLAACGGAAGPVNGPAKESLDPPPNLSVLYMKPAVDHVVTYSWWRGFGPRGGDRVTLWRHGPWVREDRALIGSKRSADAPLATTYSNLATATSFASGRDGGFTIWNGRSATGGYRLVRTAETKTLAGERCTVWRGEPVDEDRGVSRRGCITEDGIVLHESWLYSSSGEVADERIALKVERRKVAPAEVLPPKAALSWAAWLTRAGRFVPAPTGKPDNYDIRLERHDGSGWGETLRYRGSGGWQSGEEWRDGRLDRFYLWHSSGRLWLQNVAGQLSLSSHALSSPPRIGERVEPIDRPAQRILGEECRWFDTTVNVRDYSRHECRSADGLPLAVVESGHGVQGPSYRAVSISRGKTALREVMPPPGMLSWSRWGWPNLER